MKKANITKTDVFTAVLCLLAVVPGLVCYNRLPDSMPIHFDMNNQPDNYAPKAFVIFGMPILMCILQTICCIFAINKEDEKISEKVKFICRLIIPIITIMLEILTIMFSLEIYKNIGTIILCFVGLMFIIIGNYMPKCRRNAVFGIKIPSTLNSDEVWDKTHRLAGWLWVLAGIAIIPLAFNQMFLISLIVIALSVLIPVIYSIVIAK